MDMRRLVGENVRRARTQLGLTQEQFAERWMALNWAHEYRDRLKEHGWQDGPENCSPSSAA